MPQASAGGAWREGRRRRRQFVALRAEGGEGPLRVAEARRTRRKDAGTALGRHQQHSLCPKSEGGLLPPPPCLLPESP